MDWTHQRVLVTGAGGFIGSHVTERIVALGARTRALVRYNSSNSWGWLDQSEVRKDAEVVVGDIRDIDTVQQAVRGVDIIFHLAALISIPYSYRAPLSYVRTNVEGTVNLLQAAHNEGTRLFVHTSTSEVYGTARYVPIDEKHPLQGQSPYSASKIAADKMAEAFHRSFSLPVAVVRPFNTFGPRQSMRAVIPTIIARALAGPSIALGNLQTTRDFSYVDDIAQGFTRVAECDACVGETINLGSGREISIGDLVQAVGRILEKRLVVTCDERRVRPADSEVERLCADASKAQKLIGWNPRYGLDEGLAETVRWMRSHAGHYKTDQYVV